MNPTTPVTWFNHSDTIVLYDTIDTQEDTILLYPDGKTVTTVLSIASLGGAPMRVLQLRRTTEGDRVQKGWSNFRISAKDTD